MNGGEKRPFHFSGAPVVVLVVACLAATSLLAQSRGFRFIIPSLEARPGQDVRITIQGEYERSAQGFTMAATYDAANLSIERIHAEETILEAIETDFFHSAVNVAQGFFVVSALVDTKPPFDGQLIPNIERPIALVHIEARVSPQAREDVRIRLEDGLSVPPVSNFYTVDNFSVPLTELGEGVVQVARGGGPLFIRGDADNDLEVDISDAIKILRFSYLGGTTLTCMQAADVDDTERIDISDPVYLLNHLFLGGPRPPPPFRIMGADPTPGPLTCHGGS